MGRERIRCEHCGSYFDKPQYPVEGNDYRYCFSCRKSKQWLGAFGFADCSECWDKAARAMKDAATGGAKTLPFCEKHSPAAKGLA